MIKCGGWGSPVETFKVVDNGQYRCANNEEMSQSNTWHILNPTIEQAECRVAEALKWFEKYLVD